MRPPRHRLSDPPHANNAKRLAGHLTADKMRWPPAAPVTGTKLALALASTAAEHQHQSEGQVGGGVGEDAGRVADGHAMFRGGGKVYMVHPDAVIGDHPAASSTAGVHHIRIDHV